MVNALSRIKFRNNARARPEVVSTTMWTAVASFPDFHFLLIVFTRRWVLQTARVAAYGVCRCGARIAGARTFPIPPSVNNAGESLNRFVLAAKHRLVPAHGSAENVEVV